MKLVVAVSGASGAPYAKRLLDFLAANGETHGVTVDLVFTKTGKQVWRHEIGSEPRYPFRIWKNQDFTAPFASGSALYDAMVVIPCSSGALARIAYGISVDLVGRAADVMLKERRRLVLVLRETPISLVHARAITQVIEAGAFVMPASPSLLLGAEDHRRAGGHGGVPRARPARPAQRADEALGRDLAPRARNPWRNRR